MYDQYVDLQEIGRLTMNRKSFLQKEESAKQVIREAFNQCKNPYLSVSGGKDSVAMAGVVNEVAKEMNRDFVMWAHVSDASFPGTEETINETAKRLNRKIIFDHSPVSAFDVIGKGSKQQFGKKGYFFSGIEKIIKNGYDLAFVGVRAYESKRRMKAVRIHGTNFITNVPVHCNICWPIAWYRLEDVAATIVKYNLPVHPIYFKKCINKETQIRLGYVTATDLMNKGTVVFLKINYPDLYRKLAKAFPEVSKYS